MGYILKCVFLHIRGNRMIYHKLAKTNTLHSEFKTTMDLCNVQERSQDAFCILHTEIVHL
jgi:hypothetical protein